ncbi:allantoate deiminase [Paenibacillus phyllosphaerae]|uniref:Allantoate deiminase n=1 Tax=Paenibacillus phyllosphaerae TaxID=274593 RepID=A0A7W5AUF6_9BACL|nr:allantoate deiminase [Paenibacillus phyllosphaerae]MBB3108481.1 allantoate deiminase [Paenibacillus phyllosphaerae]
MKLSEHRDMAAQSTLQLLDELAVFGAEESGGVTRLLYTKPWVDAQRFLAERMRKAGLEARFDRAGNLIGRLAGTDSGSGAIVTGSHIDTVVNGGRYDGAYGVAAGIAAIEYLLEAYGPPKRTLEVISFCEEEGSRFPLTYWGSGHLVGSHSWDQADAIADASGISLREAMEAAGFGDPAQPDPVRQDIEAFVELHIEQGIVLERQQLRIGIVDTIVGQKRYIVTLEGESNHTGTTPMGLRRDALAGAAEMVVAIERLAVQYGDPLVATVGKITCEPNTPNVIAGRVSFTLDIRLDDGVALTQVSERILQELAAIAERRELVFQAVNWLLTEPAPMSPELTGMLERICQEQGVSARRMVSGAGHDAQLLTGVAKTAMIFIPSRGGISHSPDEYSTPEQLSDGVMLLTDMLYALAY